MPALKIFLFIPQHFSWQEVDSEKVHNKPRALTLVITRRLKGISVCLSLSAGPPSQLSTVDREPCHTFLIYLYSLYSSEVHFSKRGNWHLYIFYGWDTFFLSLIVWKFFLETQMRRKRINLGFGLGVPLKRKQEWRPHTKVERATVPFHVSRRMVLHHCPIHPFMRQEVREKGVIPNSASVQELRDEGDLSCTKANALIMACWMVAINICLFITK